jgi:hypothetical protein
MLDPGRDEDPGVYVHLGKTPTHRARNSDTRRRNTDTPTREYHRTLLICASDADA